MLLGSDLLSALEAELDPAPEQDRPALAALAGLPLGRARHGFPQPEPRCGFPQPEIEAFCAAGLMRELAPPALEWSRMSRLAAHLAAQDLGLALCLGGTVLGAAPLLVAGSDAQRAQYFSAMLQGKMGALGLSEWEHGSDLLGCQTTAEPSGDGFLLRGTKAPINNGTCAENVVVLARTGRSTDASALTLFLIGRDTPGLEPYPAVWWLGDTAMELSGIVLSGVRASTQDVIGQVGDGFAITRRALELTRAGVSAMSTGPAASALAIGLRHTKERVLYGAPIIELPAVQLLLADALSLLCAQLALARRTARSVARFAMGSRGHSCAAKLFCSDALETIVARVGTLLGARSIVERFDFTFLRKNAPLFAIFDGSSQLQKDELWRHASSWRTDSADAERVLRVLDTPVSAFDPHTDGTQELRACSPPAVLGLLPELQPFAAWAADVRLRAQQARGQDQSRRFAVAEEAAMLYALSAFAEAQLLHPSARLRPAFLCFAAHAAETAALHALRRGATVPADLAAFIAQRPRADWVRAF